MTATTPEASSASDDTERADQRRLLAACQVLLAPTMLQVLGALAQRPQTLAEIAATTGLSVAAVGQSIAQLQRVALVSASERSLRYEPAELARLRRILGRLNRTFFSQGRASDAHPDAAATDRHVLTSFVRDGRLIELPTNPKKMLVVLRWLARQFEEDRRYPEREVNALILRHHEDYATLRRGMVDRLLMARENGVYWRLPMPVEE